MSRKSEQTKTGGKLEPVLAHRREHRNSTIKSGRTIGEARERLETANERALARKKDKKKKALRIIFTTLGFIILAIILIILCFNFLNREESEPVRETTEITIYNPTIEIIDEDASATGGKITSRMREYIGMVEADFKDLNYTLTKAVLPTNSIREVDFYLEGYTGFIKMTIDRDSGVSVEDADRMLRYLAGQGISDFSYIDVRIDNKAYWK